MVGPIIKMIYGKILIKQLETKKNFFEIKNKKILRDYLHINDVVKIIWKLIFFK